jgi:AcrR family transcriptional regulator
LTVRGVLKDNDAAVPPGLRRPPLVSREQVVAQAIELLGAEGTSGLSMRKLASALNVSLPTVYAAVDSRNRLVQDVLDVALQQHIRETTARADSNLVDATDLLAHFAELADRQSWLHDLVGELDTATLMRVVRRSSEATSPSVLDRLALDLAPPDDGSAAEGPAREPATLLFLIVLLLDDVARLVSGGCYPAEGQGLLARALFDTMLTPATRLESVTTG